MTNNVSLNTIDSSNKNMDSSNTHKNVQPEDKMAETATSDKPQLSIVIPDAKAIDPPRPDDEEGDVKFYIGDDLTTASPLSPRENHFFDTTEDKQYHDSASIRSGEISPKEKIPPDRKKKYVPLNVEFVPPDGGFGWLVVIAACIINSWIVGFVKSYSIIYIEIKKEFPNSSAYHASWIPAMLSTIGLLIAPMVGVFCRMLTSRVVSFFGGLLCFLGLFLSVFVTSLSQLIFTIGIITGLGSGLTQIAGILIVSLYFDKRRAFASAICVSGNAIGSFFMPHLIDHLLVIYKLRGTLLILSALMLHICAASLLYRPIRVHALVQEKERRKGKKDPESGLKDSDHKDSFSLPRVLSSKLSIPNLEGELTREISFLRSTSALYSVPDLKDYAKSWNLRSNIEEKPLKRIPSVNYRTHYPKRTRTRSETISGTNVHGPFTDENKALINQKTGIADRNCRSGLNIALPQQRSVSRLSLARQISMKNSPKNRTFLTIATDDNRNSKLSLPIHEEDEENLLEIAENYQIVSEEPKMVLEDPSSDEEEKDDEKSTNSTIEEPKPSKWREIGSNMAKSFDMDIIKRPKIIVFNISAVLLATGAPHCLFYLHAYATSVGIENDMVSKILSISAAVDLVGRLGCGVIADAEIINDSMLYFISTIIASISVLCLPWTSSFVSMAIFLAVYGFGIGAWFVIMPTILAKTHGVHNLAATYGLMRFCMGIANFTSPQVSGVLIDTFDSYRSVYYFMGTCMVLGSTLILIHPQLKKTEEEIELELKKRSENN